MLGVLPFGGVLVVVVEGGVAIVAGPFPRLGEVGGAEVALPKSNPMVEVHVGKVWGAEQMHVIGHQQIMADHPRVCLLPSGKQGLMGIGLGEPRLVVLGANGEAIDGRGSLSGKHLARRSRAISGERGGISHAGNMTQLWALREGRDTDFHEF